MKGVTIKNWIPTVSLSLAAFIFVTSEFLPVGILPEIAQGFGRSEATTGLLMTGYAWIVAIMSVPLTGYMSRFDRRPLMLGLISSFVVAHVLSTFAPTFEILALSRVAVAFSHSVFWAIAIPLGVRLAPRGQRERALSVVATGATLGGILGVPVGTYIGESLGWRWSFASIGASAAVVGLILVFTLPSTPTLTTDSGRKMVPLFRRRSLIYVYLLTLILMSGHYGVFTFITPYLQTVGGFKENGIAFVLLSYGVGGLAGGLMAPKFLKSNMAVTSLVSLTCVLLSLLVMKMVVAHHLLALLLVMEWGATFAVMCLILQSLVLNLAPDAEDVAMAGFSGIFNVGIGTGALIGSLCSPAHLAYTGYIGAGLVAAAWLLCLYLTRRIAFGPATSIPMH